MDDTITTIFCLCDDFLKAMRRFDDPQVRLTTAEVITVPLVAATFFGANIDKTCRFLHEEYGYMPKMIRASAASTIDCTKSMPHSGKGSFRCWPSFSKGETLIKPMRF